MGQGQREELAASWDPKGGKAQAQPALSSSGGCGPGRQRRTLEGLPVPSGLGAQGRLFWSLRAQRGSQTPLRSPRVFWLEPHGREWVLQPH